MRSHRQHPSGFTLIEIVLVLMIVAVCAMVAGPKLANFTKGRALPNTATSLATTARWCRVQALSEGVKYRLNLDTSGNRYWVTKSDGTGLNFTEVTDEMGRLVNLPEGILMSCPDIPTTEDGTYLTFEPGGQKDVGVITLTSDTRSLNITCETPFAPYRVFDPTTEKPMR
jgi:prepilin-type N-terminal cleavage/methylation domain-containing protein